MDKLESLAIKEIIEEIEKKKRIELESRRPSQLQVRPNKRFLGRTILSVLQHNRRQYAEERRNSSRKLRELDRRRHKPRSRSRSKERMHVRKRHIERYDYQQSETDPISNEMQMDLTMHFLRMNQLLNRGEKVAKIQKKKKKKRSEILTIDLTKQKKRTKEKKRKQRKMKSKKRRRRKDSSSSSSSLSSSGIDSESKSSDNSQSSALLIDLT